MDLLESIDKVIINPIILLLFGLALLFFLWGVMQFILNMSSDDKRTEGKQHMIWGIIGLTIMFSVWAIIKFIKGTIQQFLV
ncbi:hypothetical protein COB55_01775 [Candidatus Wolfebacteria bacterium]|nr:MAG: hypothetical protein COB55_01775 [Candidatus Wolfebacteria bacterium]